METNQYKVEIHPKFLDLWKPHDFANMYGGRYGMKTEQSAKAALLQAIERPLRVLCARETLTSTKQSTHLTLKDAIFEYGMSVGQNGPYEVQEHRIIRREDDREVSEFMFKGIKEDVRNNKSLKDIDLTIVEEAAQVSYDSWNVLLPTVMGRKEGSRLWAVWNPESTADATYQMFMVDTPPNTIHINTSYKDNPWLTDTARRIVETMREKNYKQYLHIYEGMPITEIEGAIFGAEMGLAKEQGRIGDYPVDLSRPVDWVFDIGMDMTVGLGVQFYNGFYHFVDVVWGIKKPMTDYMIEIEKKPYIHGIDYLPHDAIDAITHKKLANGTVNANGIPQSIDQIVANIRSDRSMVQVVQKLNIVTRIENARNRFSRCRFNERACLHLIEALRMYRSKGPNQDGVSPNMPVHDKFSHPADAFQYALVILDERRQKVAPVTREVIGMRPGQSISRGWS